MKNKSVLVVVGIFALAVSAGSYQYYKSNVQGIYIDFKEVGLISNVYLESEACYRAGVIKKEKDADLENIMYRLRLTNMPTKDKDYVGRFKKERVEHEIMKKLEVANVLINSPDYSVLQAEIDKQYCNNVAERAKNIKSQY
jgi:hypothetical protein